MQFEANSRCYSVGAEGRPSFSASLRGLLLSRVENGVMPPASRRSRKPPPTGLGIAGVVDSADQPVVNVLFVPREYLLALLGNQLHECEGKQIAGERMPAGVGRWLWIQWADRVKRLVDLIRAGAAIDIFQWAARCAFILANMCRECGCAGNASAVKMGPRTVLNMKMSSSLSSASA